MGAAQLWQARMVRNLRRRISVMTTIATLALAALSQCSTIPNHGPQIGAPTPAMLDTNDQVDFNKKFGSTASVAVTDWRPRRSCGSATLEVRTPGRRRRSSS